MAKKMVKIILKKDWIGWHGAVHKAGTMMDVEEKDGCYLDFAGMGYPQLEIEKEYIDTVWSE